MQLNNCFASTETVGLLGTGAQDGHLDFHTPPELWIQYCLFVVLIFITPSPVTKQVLETNQCFVSKPFFLFFFQLCAHVFSVCPSSFAVECCAFSRKIEKEKCYHLPGFLQILGCTWQGCWQWNEAADSAGLTESGTVCAEVSAWLEVAQHDTVRPCCPSNGQPHYMCSKFGGTRKGGKKRYKNWDRKIYIKNDGNGFVCVVQLADCGGMPLEEQPGKVCEAFRLFLQGMGYGQWTLSVLFASVGGGWGCWWLNSSPGRSVNVLRKWACSWQLSRLQAD